MAQTYKKINLDMNTKPTDIVTAVQSDAKSRYLDITLSDKGIALNLTGHEVRIYGKKPDGKEFYNNGSITNATAGRCQFELTAQALAAVGIVEVQVLIFKDNTQILSSQAFHIYVVPSLMSNTAVESSNEYGALVVLFQNLYEAHDLMTEMVQKVGVPQAIAKSLGLNTMFQVWDWLIDYMQKNSTAGIVDKINSINTNTAINNTASKTGVLSEKSNHLINLLENPTYGLNALFSKSLIKSIQRGKAYSSSEALITVAINRVIPEKCVVLLDSEYVGFGNGGGGAVDVHGSILSSLTPTYFCITANYTKNSAYILAQGYISWQVIEFY